MEKQTHVVTGAFGYSGKYITLRLLDEGHTVKTITNSVNRYNPFGEKVTAHAFNFDQPDKLVETLKGAEVLYNTYWVRFNHKLFKHADAVQNTLTMFEAAKKAGVKKIVHVSITNPDKNSHLEYFQGKGVLEEALMNLGVPYTILRPTVIFGKEDILINNIAWMIRRFPFFGVFGDGEYKLQPIYVEDLAELAVSEGKNRENKIIDAIGPETFSYRELVATISELIGKKRKIVNMSPRIGYWGGWVVSKIVGDVLITKEEIEGLSANLLYTKSQPAGKTKLTDWIKKHADQLGKVYANELKRRKDREKAYIEK